MSADAEQPPAVRRLTTDDTAAVVGLQAAVLAGLPPGFLFPKDEVEFRAYLDGALGGAWGVVDDGALVAASLLRVPAESRPNAPPRFRLVPEEDWPLHACFLQNTMVLPVARGRGYQRALLDARLSHAAAIGMRWVGAGISLQNRVSWANLLARGMVVADIRLDLGHPIIGLLRASDPSALASDASQQRVVGASGPAQHHAALQDGYVGVRLAPDQSVIFQRLSSPAARAALSGSGGGR